MLEASSLNQLGERFIVDRVGKVQVHPDASVAGKFSLAQLYSEQAAQTLLTPQAFNHVEMGAAQGQYLVSSYIPSMDWFIVAQLRGELY